MARQTNTRLREKVIYSVFVRNHTKEGTFQALEGDLDRLAALGTDIIWLMPIHPSGRQAASCLLYTSSAAITDRSAGS